VLDFIGDVVDGLFDNILDEFLGAALSGEFAGSGVPDKPHLILLGLSPSAADRAEKDGTSRSHQSSWKSVLDLFGEIIVFLPKELAHAIWPEILGWFGRKEPVKVEGEFVLSEPNVRRAARPGDQQT
jgi:hypothetical protein